MKKIAKDEVITFYNGFLRFSEKLHRNSVWKETHSKTVVYGANPQLIEGVRFPEPECGVASLINSAALGSENARFVQVKKGLDEPIVWVVAKNDIPCNSEILLHYHFAEGMHTHD